VDILGGRQQIGIVTRLAPTGLPFEVLPRLAAGPSAASYTGVGLVYHYQCLDFQADVRVFNYRDEPELQWRVSVGLGNIGRSTDFMGGIGY
jgi:hypothetical protein